MFFHTGQDCMGCAKTGSGKTAAFVLPVLQKLSEDPYGIFCLVLTPTRSVLYTVRKQKTLWRVQIHVLTWGEKIHIITENIKSLQKKIIGDIPWFFSQNSIRTVWEFQLNANQINKDSGNNQALCLRSLWQPAHCPAPRHSNQNLSTNSRTKQFTAQYVLNSAQIFFFYPFLLEINNSAWVISLHEDNRIQTFFFFCFCQI